MLNSGQVKLVVGNSGLLFSYIMPIQPSLPLPTHPTPQPRDLRALPTESKPVKHSQPVSAEVKKKYGAEN